MHTSQLCMIVVQRKSVQHADLLALLMLIHDMVMLDRL